jgi:hypothetical protein
MTGTAMYCAKRWTHGHELRQHPEVRAPLVIGHDGFRIVGNIRFGHMKG